MRKAFSKKGYLRIRIGSTFEYVMNQVREKILQTCCPHGACTATCAMRKGAVCLMARNFAIEDHRAPRRNVPAQKSPAKGKVVALTREVFSAPTDDQNRVIERVRTKGSIPAGEMEDLR
jgi:hypothetical protein